MESLVKNLMVKLLVLSLLLNTAQAAFGQVSPKETIPIAIPDAKPFGIDQADQKMQETAELYTNLIITSVSSIPYFNVLERQRSNELYDEIAYQLTNARELTDAVANSALQGARALLITGFGELFGRVVITARLVDLQTGRVLFADAIYIDSGDPSSLKRELDELTASIREKGSELGRVVELVEIERAINAKSWREAKQLADLYLRERPGDTQVRALYEDIAAKRADELYREAKNLVRLKLYREARVAIDEAIALLPKSAFYAYRDTIGQADLDYQFKLKADARRREEALRLGSSTNTVTQSISEYLGDMSSQELRLGGSYKLGLVNAEDLLVEFDDGDWGLEFGWTDSYRPLDGKAVVSWIWYAGVSVAYETLAEGGSGASFAAWLSPLLAQSVKLGPLILSAGLDTGAFFQFGPFDGESWRLGWSAGANLQLALRVFKDTGIFVATKADWRFFLDDAARDGPAIRILAGITL
jgi:TolB-like protein